MRSPAQRRLTMGALCACAIGLAYQVSMQADETDAAEVSLAAPRRARPAPAVAMPTPDVAKDDADADPFAPRGWDAVPAPIAVTPAPVAAPVIAVPDAPPPAPVAPALPFTFMGRLSDGATAMVYISRGEESWTVKGGETLDGNYKVASVTPQQIVFEHVPTGTQQTLSLPEADK
jgi:hypothetical protein